MTRMQKLLRPALNFLIERYFPNGAFYGMGYFDAIKVTDEDRGIGYATVLSLSNSLVEINATEYSCVVKSLSLLGVPIGDWRLTFEQIERTDEYPKKVDSGIFGMTDNRDFTTGERFVEFQEFPTGGTP